MLLNGGGGGSPLPYQNSTTLPRQQWASQRKLFPGTDNILPQGTRSMEKKKKRKALNITHPLRKKTRFVHESQNDPLWPNILRLPLLFACHFHVSPPCLVQRACYCLLQWKTRRSPRRGLSDKQNTLTQKGRLLPYERRRGGGGRKEREN